MLCTSSVGVRWKRLVVFAVEKIDQRLQQRPDVFAAVVTKLHEKVKQTQHLSRPTTTATENSESSTTLKPGFHYPSWRPELTARVDGWPVSIIRQHGPFPLAELTARMETGYGNRSPVN